MHHRSFALPVALFALTTSFACSEDALDLADADEDAQSEGPLDEDPDGTDNQDESSEEPGNEPGEDSEAPTIRLLLDGSAQPPPLESAATLSLQADASDASGVARVDFYLDDELLTSDAEAPYELQVIAPDASFNGVRRFSALAYDPAGNQAEGSLLLPVALPQMGSREWEYVAPEAGRWLSVFVGAEDSALVVGTDSLLRISAEGEPLSEYDFGHPVSAATASEDGGVIALGTMDDTLVYHRFGPQGQSLFLDFLDDFGGPNVVINDAAIADNDRLIISSVSPYDGEDTARISSVGHGLDVMLEWHHYLVRDGQSSDHQAGSLAVGPTGEIYTTATFDGEQGQVWQQLRQVGQGGYPWWTFEESTPLDARYADVVATEDGIFVAGRQDGQAAIARFDEGGDMNALYFVGGDEVAALERHGQDLIYASMSNAPGSDDMELGRLSPDGVSLWSSEVSHEGGGPELPRDIAVSALGHVYVISERELDIYPRLQRFHP